MVPSRLSEAVVRDAVATETDGLDRLSFAVAELTSPDGWAAAVDGVDYVLHVAAPCREPTC